MNNNNILIAEMLHESAMEASDLADIARIKKKPDEQIRHLKRAYTLEREAALKLQIEPDENFWKYIFLKSAGWMAYELGLYEEAIQLTELGLAGNATGVALYRLQELKKALEEKLGEEFEAKRDTLILKNQLYGVLTCADLEQEEVKLKESGETKYRIIKTSKELIQTVARYLIGEFVEINAEINENGMLLASQIRRPIGG